MLWEGSLGRCNRWGVGKAYRSSCTSPRASSACRAATSSTGASREARVPKARPRSPKAPRVATTLVISGV